MRDPPAQPDGATIVKPLTPAAKAATDRFLNWVGDLRDVALENADRARLARDQVCGAR